MPPSHITSDASDIQHNTLIGFLTQVSAYILFVRSESRARANIGNAQKKRQEFARAPLPKANAGEDASNLQPADVLSCSLFCNFKDSSEYFSLLNQQHEPACAASDAGYYRQGWRWRGSRTASFLFGFSLQCAYRPPNGHLSTLVSSVSFRMKAPRTAHAHHCDGEFLHQQELLMTAVRRLARRTIKMIQTFWIFQSTTLLLWLLHSAGRGPFHRW